MRRILSFALSVFCLISAMCLVSCKEKGKGPDGGAEIVRTIDNQNDWINALNPFNFGGFELNKVGDGTKTVSYDGSSILKISENWTMDSENHSVENFYTKEGTTFYQYTKEDDSSNFEKRVLSEGLLNAEKRAYDFASNFSFSAFTYNSSDNSYESSSAVINGESVQNVKLKFENKKIVSINYLLATEQYTITISYKAVTLSAPMNFIDKTGV